MDVVHYLLLFQYCIAVYFVNCKRQIHDEPDYSKIEYGGILHKKDTTVSSQDKDLVAVIQYSYSFVKERFPWSVPDFLNQTKTSDVEKLELVYSIDEENPVYKEDLMQQGHDGVSPLHVILFGFLYKFTLYWETQKEAFAHQFTVSMFPREVLNMYSHIYSDPQSHTQGTPPSVSCESNPQPMTSQSDVLLQREEGSHEYFHKDASHWLKDSDQSSCKREPSDGVSSDKKHQSKPDFTVMSFNTWNMNSLSGKEKHYVKRIQYLGEVVARSKPDIIGFQEVRYEYSKGGQLGPSQVQHLVDMLEGYQFVFQPGQLQPNSLYEGRTEEGVAIFSRFPIMSVNHLLLFRNRSNSADTHQRVCLHAVISHPTGTQINILNTHLSLSHEAREKAVLAIWKYVKQLQGPVIFMGDLNAEPEEQALKFLRGEVSLENQQTTGFVDVWSETHGQDTPGLTYNTLKQDLSKRIDYIFMKKSKHMQIVEVTTPDDERRGHKAASDHLPVFAKFTLSTPET
ncbi:uncharacterized protein LOC110455435 isoform X2 [Mizuhopecten yessoensis]|uniref:Endonuclease/exonuclease/phosphatase domain-containing protein n=1 Tax=Mizuhopecten yessoensis TaxID=6573 RepID=A0A210QD59_MIZYE|nr:uncharacterized protein LOC110455435 isoform X1 [Mizuhopecten yessoensis]XP_021361248.1 uncharacterized protein LOC110455435 isoform X2 [Mizuhopecten yessoensis]OWF46666.1 hypothetical protein KP79_PYT17689 [Mizuhopecten yessoensis]